VRGPPHRLMSERELRARVIDLVRKARGQIPPGATPEEVAQRFGLQVRLGDLPDGKDGAYLEDSRAIVVSQVVTSKERRNFTCYHELVHHLIRQDDPLYSYLHETYSDAGQFEGVIELLCNVGAAELIIPQEQVRALIEAEGFTLTHLPRLCTDRDVSAPAGLIQLVLCAPHPCYGVACDFGLSPIQHHQGQHSFIASVERHGLYILYAVWSPSARYKIARGTVIRDGHLLAQAYQEQRFLSGEEIIPFRSGTKWKVHCEAMYFRGRVYGIFSEKSPVGAGQPRLF